MAAYDAIVIGAGGVGSAAMYHLAQRGCRVVGLERFHPVHDRGSSHGATRIIRQAYFEHPDYVPLLLTAYDLWEQLAAACGRRLFHRTGLLQAGPSDGTVVSGVLASAVRFNLPVERLSAAEASDRFPGFRIPADMAAVYESRGGCLDVEACVEAHLAGAIAAGAELRTGVTVREWGVDGAARGGAATRGATGGGATVHVRLDDETLVARRLVVTAGPWAATLLADLNIPLRVERRVQAWFDTKMPMYSATAGCPTFLFELPEGVFYGCPRFDSRGVKVAEHSGSCPVADPLHVDRTVHDTELRRLEVFLAGQLPLLTGRSTGHCVCLYTMTPDGHFVVDRHPHHPEVVFAAGLSGHGFKFAAVLGRVLADLTVDGATELPIEFLSANRPAISRRSEVPPGAGA